VREAQWERAALSYRSTVLGALSEVESALSSYRAVDRRIAALEAAVQSASEAAELADQRYAAGLVDLLSVLDTEQTVFSTEEQLVIAKGDQVAAFSNLYRALGGGWDPNSTPSASGGKTDA
ncbi:MAG: TolC family protein, partial [Acidobacteriota bacterium]